MPYNPYASGITGASPWNSSVNFQAQPQMQQPMAPQGGLGAAMAPTPGGIPGGAVGGGPYQDLMKQMMAQALRKQMTPTPDAGNTPIPAQPMPG